MSGSSGTLPPRALFLRNGADDRAASLRGFEGVAGVVQRRADQSADAAFSERSIVLDPYEPHEVTAAAQQPLRIGHVHAAEETKAHLARIDHDREERLRRAFGRTKADHERIRVVIDELYRPGKPITYHRQRAVSQPGDLGREPSDEKRELLLLGRFRHPRPRPLLLPESSPIAL